MKLRLIDDWGKAHHFWSMRLAAAASAAGTLVLAFPDVLVAIGHFLPLPVRVAIGAAVFALFYLLRVTKQETADAENP